MSFRTSLFLALRYLKPRLSFTTISTGLSILGPVIGVAMLIVVLSVMNGFHRELRKRFFGFNAHLSVYHFSGTIDDAAAAVKEVEKLGYSATPTISAPGMVQFRKRAAYHSFIGIDPKTDPDVTEFREKCKNIKNRVGTETLDFSSAYDSLEEGQVICGRKFLVENGLRIGEKIVVHPVSRLESMLKYKEDGTVEVQEMDEAYVPVELTIVGAFSFDMHQFDSSMSIIHIDQAANDFADMEWGNAKRIKVNIKEPFLYKQAAKRIAETPAFADFGVQTWRQENEGFFRALQVEKTVMFVLLMVMVLISTFCLCATLITIVFQKTHEIGILKAMGAHPMTIMMTFFIQGAIIGALGVLLGSLGGFGLLSIRNEFLAWLRESARVLPPDLYFFNELPASVEWVDVISVNTGAFILCILAAVIPALMGTSISPSKAIKAE